MSESLNEEKEWQSSDMGKDLLAVALRDVHKMPDHKPKKAPSQKEIERQRLSDDIDAYMAAGGQIIHCEAGDAIGADCDSDD